MNANERLEVRVHFLEEAPLEGLQRIYDGTIGQIMDKLVGIDLDWIESIDARFICGGDASRVFGRGIADNDGSYQNIRDLITTAVDRARLDKQLRPSNGSVPLTFEILGGNGTRPKLTGIFQSSEAFKLCVEGMNEDAQKCVTKIVAHIPSTNGDEGDGWTHEGFAGSRPLSNLVEEVIGEAATKQAFIERTRANA